jgi:hypothetical protein
MKELDKENSNIVINLKKNKDIVSHTSSNKELDDLKNNFYTLFDYEYLYTLIKEIKLLKFLILNDRRREYIEYIKSIPINIERFEKSKIDDQAVKREDKSIDQLLLAIKNILL